MCESWGRLPLCRINKLVRSKGRVAQYQWKLNTLALGRGSGRIMSPMVRKSYLINNASTFVTGFGSADVSKV